MARIPLQNGGYQPTAPQGARVPLSQNLPIGQTPIPRQGEQWAQAIGQASEAFQIIAQKTAQANDTRQLLEAEGEMRRHAMEFQQFQQTTQDQDQWLPEWQKRQTGMQKYIDGLKLTDGARLRLTSSFGQWSDNHAVAIQGEAFKQSVGRARMAVFTRGEEFAKAGNLDSAINSLSMLPENAAWPEEIEAKKADYGRMATDAANSKEFENLGVIGVDNPRVAKELAVEYEQAGKISAPQRVRIMDIADSRLRELHASAVRGVADNIKLGKVPSPDELRANPDLEDIDRLALINLATNTPANDSEVFERVMTQIDTYKPQPGDDLAKAKFEVFLESNFSGPYLDGLKAKWAEKSQAGASTVDTGEAFSMLDKWAFDDQRLGEYKKPALDAKGNPVLKKKEGGYVFDPTAGLDFWGLREAGDYVKQEDAFEPVMNIDPVARDRAMKSVGSIKETIRREIKEGKITESDGVVKRMAELAKMPLVKQAASETGTAPNPLLPAIDAPKVDLNEILKRYAPNPGK